MPYFIEVPVIVVKEFEVEADTPQEAFKKVYNRQNDKSFEITVIDEYDELEYIYVYDAYGKEWGPEKVEKWINEMESDSSMDLL